MKIRKLAAWSLKICVLGLLLYVIARRIDVKSVAQTSLEVHVELLALALALKVIVVALKSQRWGRAIEGLTGIRPAKRLFSSTMVGVAGNLFLPARMGEVARVALFRKKNNTPISTILASLGVIHFLDLFLLSLYFSLVTFSGGLPIAVSAKIAWSVMIGIPAMILAGWGALFVFPKALRSFITGVTSRLPQSVGRPLESMGSRLLENLERIRSSPQLPVLGVSTIAVWVAETGAIACALAAFQIPVTPLMAASLLVILNLSFVVPLTPGNVGIHQLIAILVLGSYGIAEQQALAFSIGFQLLVTTLFGLWGGIVFVTDRASGESIEAETTKSLVLQQASRVPA
ncbi:MAG: lysylphosphatidylglycerol synthase transmembrane domain-containing protein [Gemmataceae bacterium]